MPLSESAKQPLPLHVLAKQKLSFDRATDLDFLFMKKICLEENVPEYGGFNTAFVRNLGYDVKPKTKAVYLPLVDMPPAEPTTMLTAMHEAQRVTQMTGQEFTIFTNDQQLYRVVVGITWVYKEHFLTFIPRLGGMHTLMSFVGAIGTLMGGSGLEEVMEVAFGGVQKMLAGKKFPQNVRALRIVAEEVLRKLFKEESVQCYADLVNALENKSERSRTAKHWIDNLIKPVFIMMMFVRAEREGDWSLHLLATKSMMPYFFAAGHFNYARYFCSLKNIFF